LRGGVRGGGLSGLCDYLKIMMDIPFIENAEDDVEVAVCLHLGNEASYATYPTTVIPAKAGIP
jgi:hypothetical protein